MRRRAGTILLVGGIGTVAWCLSVLASADLYHWYQNWRLDRALEHPASAPPLPFAPPKMHALIGRLEIPRLHISTIVLEGDDAHVLRYGAGHVPGTSLPDRLNDAQPGNIGIAGHRDTFFRPLRHIKPHDRIALITPAGERDYTVESTEIVSPNDVGVLSPSHSSELTLITCYPFYYVGPAPRRFIVHARQAAFSAGISPTALR
jgi:sortase A